MSPEPRDLPIWTIYFGASDMPPGVYRVRRGLVKPGTFEHDLEATDYPTLEAARAPLIERGLYRLDRHPGDEKPIVECWI